MPNQIYYLIRTNNADNRIELHVSHNPDDVFNLESLSKSISTDNENWKGIVENWRWKMKTIYRATEFLSHTIKK